MKKIVIKIIITEEQFDLVREFTEQEYRDFVVHICKSLNISPDKVVINWEIKYNA